MEALARNWVDAYERGLEFYAQSQELLDPYVGLLPGGKTVVTVLVVIAGILAVVVNRLPPGFLISLWDSELRREWQNRIGWLRECTREFNWTFGPEQDQIELLYFETDQDRYSQNSYVRTNLLIFSVRLYLQSLRPTIFDAKVNLVDKGLTIQQQNDRELFSDHMDDYKIVKKHSELAKWHRVYPNVNLWYQEERTEKTTTKSGSLQSWTSGFKVKATGFDAPKIVDAFLVASYEHYKNEMTKRYVEKRRLFCPSGDFSNNTFKSYDLSDSKTMESLYFEEKASLVKLVDDFLHKRNKFAIQGFPYKLGLLLHGGPGTGKTSLIKALSLWTQRDVVSINLGAIKSNQKLYDVMFDLKFNVPNEDIEVKKKFGQVIFALEDVDCMNRVVLKRKKEKRYDGLQLDSDDTDDNRMSLFLSKEAAIGPANLGESRSFKKMGNRQFANDKLSLSGL
eukprot:Filipodium_phascolosomae@DN2739_c0_g3_i2.p1